jgi:uncharacterized protein
MFKILIFLLWGNFMPPLTRLVLDQRWAQPLDGGRLWRDGWPLFGPHKTVRGVVAIVLGGIVLFPILGIAWWQAGFAAVLIVAGDLLSSFIKRRLKLTSGRIAPGLDQFFEGFLPALYLWLILDLPWWQMVAALGFFVFLAFLGSLIWNYLLVQPAASGKNQPRLVRSRQRYKHWRACHPPLANWQLWLNFENYFFYRLILGWFFKGVGLYHRGKHNCLDIRVESHEMTFADLPPAFDGFRILLLTDLHLDGLDGLTEAAASRLRDIQADLCLIGGDIRMEVYGPMAPALRQLKCLMGGIDVPHGVFGVLGNHDCIEMVPDLEDAGLVMLINDSQAIEINGEQIWLVGIDDPHYYKVHDLQAAFQEVPAGSFAILLAHSSEAYVEAADRNVRLYLCGHTHGGQICTPAGRPLFTHCRAPRRLVTGTWLFSGMQGYTSRGLGPSGVPLRFNCPGEITLITLKRGESPPLPTAN